MDAGICVGGATVVLALYYRQRKKYAYPPGPKGLPVIGNVLDMPRMNPWVAFRDWSRKMSMSYSCTYAREREKHEPDQGPMR